MYFHNHGTYFIWQISICKEYKYSPKFYSLQGQVPEKIMKIYSHILHYIEQHWMYLPWIGINWNMQSISLCDVHPLLTALSNSFACRLLEQRIMMFKIFTQALFIGKNYFTLFFFLCASDYISKPLPRYIYICI